MLFYLTTMNLERFLTNDAPNSSEGETDMQVFNAVDARKHFDYLRMNGLHDSLYSIYSAHKITKALWKPLDNHKYKIDNVGAKKIVVGRLLDYMMVDSTNVTS